eukprot:COSAG03_NODE_1689_length_3645_cov_3.831923_6_plen_325_part_00
MRISCVALAHRETQRETERHRERQRDTERHRDLAKATSVCVDVGIEEEHSGADRQTDSQTASQPARQTDRQTDTDTDTHTQTQTQTESFACTHRLCSPPCHLRGPTCRHFSSRVFYCPRRHRRRPRRAAQALLFHPPPTFRTTLCQPSAYCAFAQETTARKSSPRQATRHRISSLLSQAAPPATKRRWCHLQSGGRERASARERDREKGGERGKRRGLRKQGGSVCARQGPRPTISWCGPRYEQSTLMLEPIGPSTAHPACSPNPMFTRKPGILCTEHANARSKSPQRHRSAMTFEACVAMRLARLGQNISSNQGQIDPLPLNA